MPSTIQALWDQLSPAHQALLAQLMESLATVDAPLADDATTAAQFAMAVANTTDGDEGNGLGYALASQEVLARDWLTPEDAAIDWDHWIIPDEE